jgi:hypothetical protein
MLLLDMHLPWCCGLRPRKCDQPPGEPGLADAAVVVVPRPTATEMPS